MDAGTSGLKPDSPQAYLLVEDWVRVASGALVVYDYLLTFGLEVEMLRRRRTLTAPTIIFLLNRYITLPRYVLDILSRHSSTAVWRNSCFGLMITTDVFVIFMYSVWAVFATVRIYPFTETRWLPAIVFAMYLCPVAAQTFLFVKGAPPSFTAPNLCLQTDKLPWYMNTSLAVIVRSAMIFGDFLVVYAVWTCTRTTRAVVKAAQVKHSLARTLLRNGVLYFLVLSLLNLVHLACWLTNFFSGFMGTLGEALTSIVISRFLLNLWDYNRSCLADTIATSQFTTGTLDFVHPGSDAGEDSESDSDWCEDAGPPAPRPGQVQVEGGSSSFCRRVAEFVEPFGAPVGGFLGELGLPREDGDPLEGSEHVVYILDVEKVWRD